MDQEYDNGGQLPIAVIIVRNLTEKPELVLPIGGHNVDSSDSA
jgi:hypothetical protein